MQNDSRAGFAYCTGDPLISVYPESHSANWYLHSPAEKLIPVGLSITAFPTDV